RAGTHARVPNTSMDEFGKCPLPDQEIGAATRVQYPRSMFPWEPPPPLLAEDQRRSHRSRTVQSGRQAQSGRGFVEGEAGAQARRGSVSCVRPSLPRESTGEIVAERPG